MWNPIEWDKLIEESVVGVALGALGTGGQALGNTAVNGIRGRAAARNAAAGGGGAAAAADSPTADVQFPPPRAAARPSLKD